MNTIGLGCMGFSGVYGATDDAESVRTIQHAIDKGVDFLDTGDFYGMGHNEMLIGRAISGRRDQVRLSVKFGAQRGPDGAWLGFDARPAALKTACAYSLKRLGVEVIDVYRPARLDAHVPIEDTVGAMADLVKAGYVRAIGLSEVGSETVRRAAKVHAIADVQLEYSIASRRPEDGLFATLRELGISATLYGVYSRGLLTGATLQGKGDSRGWLPRFSSDNAAKNKVVVERIAQLAAKLGMTSAQLLVGWVLAKQPGFMPLVGPKRSAQLDDALGARALSSADVAALEEIVPHDAIAGDRYVAEQMKHLDSER